MMVEILLVLSLVGYTHLNGWLSEQGDLTIGDAQKSVVGGAFWLNELPLEPSEGITFSLNGGVSISSEQREEPTYDRFGNTVGYMSFYSKHSLYPQIPAADIKFVRSSKLIRLSYKRIYDFNYRYKRIYRDDTYTVIGQSESKRHGGVDELALSFGVLNIKKTLNFSISLARILGKDKVERHLVMRDSVILDTVEKFRAQATTVKVAAMLRLGYRASIGLAFRKGFKLQEGSKELSYPDAFEVSARVTPPSKMTTHAFFNYLYDGNIHYGMGFEHEIIRNEWIRFGARLDRNFDSPAEWTPVYALGFTHSGNKFEISTGVNIIPASYRTYWDSGYYKVKEVLTEFLLQFKLKI